MIHAISSAHVDQIPTGLGLILIGLAFGAYLVKLFVDYCVGEYDADKEAQRVLCREESTK